MPSAAPWIDLKIVLLSKVSQTEEKYPLMSLMWNLKIKKIDTNELNKTERDPQR